MCHTWDVEGLLREIPNRLYIEWMLYWKLKNEYEEAAVKLAQRKAKSTRG